MGKGCYIFERVIDSRQTLSVLKLLRMNLMSVRISLVIYIYSFFHKYA